MNWHRVHPRTTNVPYLRLSLGHIHQVARVVPSNKGAGYKVFYDLPDALRLDGANPQTHFPTEKEAKAAVESVVQNWLDFARLSYAAS